MMSDGVAVLVVVDLDLVEDVVVEGVVVRARARLLPRDHVHDERDLPVGGLPIEVRLVVADEDVDVGDVGGRIERHQRRLAMAGAACRPGGEREADAGRHQRPGPRSWVHGHVPPFLAYRGRRCAAGREPTQHYGLRPGVGWEERKNDGVPPLATRAGGTWRGETSDGTPRDGRDGGPGRVKR